MKTLVLRSLSLGSRSPRSTSCRFLSQRHLSGPPSTLLGTTAIHAPLAPLTSAGKVTDCARADAARPSKAMTKANRRIGAPSSLSWQVRVSQDASEALENDPIFGYG